MNTFELSFKDGQWELKKEGKKKGKKAKTRKELEEIILASYDKIDKPIIRVMTYKKDGSPGPEQYYTKKENYTGHIADYSLSDLGL